MTKRHFELLAETIRDADSRFKSNQAHALFASAMAVSLATTNERFDRKRFILACMPRWMVGTAKSNVWERLANR